MHTRLAIKHISHNVIAFLVPLLLTCLTTFAQTPIQKRTDHLLRYGESITIAGALEVLHYDDPKNGMCGNQYFLIEDNGTSSIIYFQEEPYLPSGERIQIEGKTITDKNEIVALNYKIITDTTVKIAGTSFVPTGLTATDVDRDGTPRCDVVTLRWNAASHPSGIKGYNIYRDGTFWLYTTSTANAIQGFFLSDTTYTYEISAINNDDEESEKSTPVDYTTFPCWQKAHLGELNTAIILLKFADFPDEPFDLTYSNSVAFDFQYSLKNYLEEVSYGRQTLTGESYGWYQLSGTKDDYCSFEIDGLGYGCNIPTMKSEALALIESDLDVNSVNRFIYAVEGMGTAGLAGGVDIWVSGTQGFLVMILAHEMGHNLGGMHSGGWRCGTELVGPSVDDVREGDCQPNERSDTYDVLAWRMRHYNAIKKEVMGFLTPDQIVTANLDGVYILDNIETPSEGIKQLRIPLTAYSQFPHTFYFLEYRKQIGFDSEITEGLDYVDGGTADPDIVDGVQIRLHRDRANGFATFDTAYIETVINPGQEFYDPYREVRVTVLEKMGDSVRVCIGNCESTAIPIPTMSTWGVLMFSLLVMGTGTILIRRS